MEPFGIESTVNEANANWVRRLKSLSIICGSLVICIALLSLLGHLKIFPKFTLFQTENMRPVFSLGFICLSISFFLLYDEHAPPIFKHIAIILASLVTVATLLRIAEIFSGRDLWVGNFLVDPYEVEIVSFTTKEGFLFIELAFFLLLFKRGIPFSQICAFTAHVLALLYLIDIVFIYVLNQTSLEPADRMKLISAFCFYLISLQCILLRPTQGFGALFVSNHFVGKMIRLQLPIMFVMMMLVGAVRFIGETRGFYQASFGVSLMVVSSIVFFTVIVFRSGYILESLDAKRRLVEQQVVDLNASLEARIAERTKQLEIANHELEAFSYSVSHDLRAPLRTIDGFSRLLEERFTSSIPEEGRRFIGLIRKGSHDMGTLIDDLLNFSRLSRHPMQKDMVNTNALVKEVVEKMDGDINDGKTKLSVGDLADCYGDRHLLFQVYFNLISNAYKFTRKHPQPTIVVGQKDHEGKKIFYVQDNGAGFDMRYVNKLFGVFQRLHSSDEFPGTGVGLAIVKRIIERHGGEIWAEGAVNQGATFYFTL